MLRNDCILHCISSVMEKHLRLMMTCVDELTQDANKFSNYMRQAARQKQLQQQKRVTDIIFF